MNLIVGVLAGIALVCIAWQLCVELVTPLPRSADTVFRLDSSSENELEYAVRGFRFLKKIGYIQGRFLIVLCAPSVQGRRMAALFARQEDIILIEENGHIRPE